MIAPVLYCETWEYLVIKPLYGEQPKHCSAVCGMEMLKIKSMPLQRAHSSTSIGFNLTVCCRNKIVCGIKLFKLALINRI